MTAVVGILNKTGIAIAADSAVTVGSIQGSKVYNFANKIFMLSKYRPVGIVIYSSADFMGIPWEVLIKEYRNELDERSFGSLKEYQEDFVNWMIRKELFYSEANPLYFTGEVTQFLSMIFADYFNAEQSVQITLSALKQIEELYSSGTEDTKVLLSFDDEENMLLTEKITPIVHELIDLLGHEQNERDELTSRIVILVLDCISKDIFLNYTGVAFTGYGDAELFPRLVSTKVSIALSKNKLRYVIDEEIQISYEMESAVIPFAQKDVIQTILQGMSPRMLQTASNIFKGFLDEIVKVAQQSENFAEDQITRVIDLMSDRYRQGLENEMMSEHYYPMLRTINHLGREDLAEMAESLIYMTYLNRRFTMQEESVGGPVDVALITKGDGFVWMKRKHYFEPETNHHFFNNYFSTSNGARNETEL